MKAQVAARRIEAFNRTELLVVIGVTALLAAMILPALRAAHKKTGRINCVNNLHDIGSAFKTWEGDHSDKHLIQTVLANEETMKLVSSGKAYLFWQTLSNGLSKPKVLHCLDDTRTTAATSFTINFSDSNIRYFFSPDAFDTYPQMILDGDDNLATNDVRVLSGILNLPTANSLAWSHERHYRVGNICMADGSVMQTTSNTLNSAVIAATNGTPFTTYRWVIP